MTSSSIFHRSKGFTLIELLVVISIIALLSSIVLSALGAARAKARDARRSSDLSQLRTAFNLYINDNAGNLPVFGVSCLGISSSATCWAGYPLNGGGYGTYYGNNALNTALAPYLSSIPLDPSPTRSIGDAYIYFRGWGDVHCNGIETVYGNWLLYQPDTINPSTDSQCKVGGATTACCSGVSCGAVGFCLYRLDK